LRHIIYLNYLMKFKINKVLFKWIILIESIYYLKVIETFIQYSN
jgi:hypothetical protein